MLRQKRTHHLFKAYRSKNLTHLYEYQGNVVAGHLAILGGIQDLSCANLPQVLYQLHNSVAVELEVKLIWSIKLPCGIQLSYQISVPLPLPTSLDIHCDAWPFDWIIHFNEPNRDRLAWEMSVFQIMSCHPFCPCWVWVTHSPNWFYSCLFIHSTHGFYFHPHTN